MKRGGSFLLALILALGLLAGCGESESVRDVDLTAFYDSLAESYGWEEAAPLEGTLLERAYPSLSDYPMVQLVAAVPQTAAAVSELLFLECEEEAAAEAVAEICRARVQAQASGAVNSAEAAAWSEAEVLQDDCYVALVADAENGEAIVAAWNTFFS